MLTRCFETTCCETTWAEHGPDGKYHGRYVCAAGGLDGYMLLERGVKKESAWFHHATGMVLYNNESCAPDDARVAALIARATPVVELANAAATEAEEAVVKLPLRLAGLELMVTMLLARDRHPPTVAAGVAAELLSLHSGLLAMVCDAIVLRIF